MRTWDLLQTATNKQKLNVDEDTVIDLVMRGKLLDEDCVRPVGKEKWYRVSKLRDQFEKLHAQRLEKAGVASAAQTSDEELPSTRVANPDDVDAEVDITGQVEEEPAPEPAPPPKRKPQKPFKKKQVDLDDEAPFAKRSLEVDEYDLTPMVDMAFLLNMFFMLTTAYALLHSMRIPAPKPEDVSDKSKKSAPMTKDEMDAMIIVQIEADNTIRIEDTVVQKDAITQGLQSRLTDKASVLIKAHPDAYHESLVSVFDACNELKIQNISLARVSTD